ncbi:MAG: tRNA (N6-isopentenyl adenosine(37)-C2)-methylthiotransferase MiaB, partial [Clostridiales bacterium]|nr:tRNA (N6-isopentenyl adenosine(37)-C2)-methylthiotransferase MiaB [Clostridiales bacterium]
ALNPSLIIGVCGCMMQQEEVAKKLMRRFPFVDLVFGTHIAHRLPEILLRVLAGERVTLVNRDAFSMAEGLSVARTPGVSAFVNIMYGCDNYCSYCIVPFVRGRERSRLPEDILAECRALVAQGYTEITLLGQNVNSYGEGFPALLREVAATSGLRRIRFMTSHPKDISDELIETMAELESVCSYLHLPVQSGSDPVLARMNRRYTAAQYLEITKKLRTRIPDIELTTDIIVGFPGETDEEFAQTLALVREVGFTAAFTFKYSPRSGTVAATMPDQVPEAVKRERLKRLNELQAEITAASAQKFIGYEGEVLVEGRDGRDPSLVFGKFGNARMVYFPGNADLIGSYVWVRVTKTRRNSLFGEMI